MNARRTIRWGIVGPGAIAEHFAQNFPVEDDCELIAVAGRTREHSESYAQRHGIPRIYESDADLAADPDIDVVYVATPTSAHVTNIKTCLAAGKHVLCEKTITMTLAQLDECAEMARRNHVILCEGLTSVFEPVMPFMKRKIASGEYGKVHFITVTCGSDKPYDATNRFFSPELGGGAIFDIGCYAIGFASYFMTSYPDIVHSEGYICDTGVDMKSAYVLRNADDELATVAISLRSKTEKIGIIACERAFIRIEQFIRAHRATVSFPDGRTESYDFPVRQLEAEALAMNADIRLGREDSSLCPIELSRSVLFVMDKARRQWGYRFGFEEA